MPVKLVRTTAKPIQVSESATVELRWDAAAMWSYMWNPASSVELGEHTEVGLTLPGTSYGLGEIQVFLHRLPDGRRQASLIEVVEFEPGRRAVTRSLVSAVPNLSVLTIEPLGPGSCRLTQEHRADLPAGIQVAIVEECRKNFREELRQLMSRLTELTPR
ncbi:hypothetical protein AB0F81_03080 [Actinoplanes sp. NPDC024001]|uniref:hypothetical protein n=1 Tax=Actinoplanes sp. NPDC024001 TaxID=3154598 RepID=UPI0033DD0C64